MVLGLWLGMVLCVLWSAAGGPDGLLGLLLRHPVVGRAWADAQVYAAPVAVLSLWAGYAGEGGGVLRRTVLILILGVSGLAARHFGLAPFRLALETSGWSPADWGPDHPAFDGLASVAQALRWGLWIEGGAIAVLLFQATRRPPRRGFGLQF